MPFILCFKPSPGPPSVGLIVDSLFWMTTRVDGLTDSTNCPLTSIPTLYSVPNCMLGIWKLKSFLIFSYSLDSICVLGFAVKITSLRDLLSGNEVDTMLLMANTVVEFCFSAAAFTVVPVWSPPFMGVEGQIMGLLFCWGCMVIEQEVTNFFLFLNFYFILEYSWFTMLC